MTQENVFNSETSENQPTSLVDELVGENKKFKTVEDLAKGKRESDAFIEQLKAENAEMREDLKKLDNAEATFETLKNEIKELKTKANTSSPKPDTREVLTKDALKELVVSSLTEIESARTSEQNTHAASTSLITYFGNKEKVQEALTAKAKELGLSVEELGAMAARSPSALFTLMGINEKGTSTEAFKKSDVNTNRLGADQINKGLKKGTRAYFNEIRRKMGRQAFYADSKLMKEVWDSKVAGNYDS